MPHYPEKPLTDLPDLPDSSYVDVSDFSYQEKRWQDYQELIPWYLNKEQEVILLLEKALDKEDFDQLGMQIK